MSQKNVDRRTFLRGVTLTAGSVGFAAVASKPRRAAAKVPPTINASFFLGTHPFMIAKGEGWFERQTGSKFNWSELSSAAEVNAAMASGSLNVGFTVGSVG